MLLHTVIDKMRTDYDKVKPGDYDDNDDEEANDEVEVSDLENKEAWATRKASTMTVGSQRGGGSALVSTLEGVQVVRSVQKP